MQATRQLVWIDPSLSAEARGCFFLLGPDLFAFGFGVDTEGALIVAQFRRVVTPGSSHGGCCGQFLREAPDP